MANADNLEIAAEISAGQVSDNSVLASEPDAP